MNPIKSIELYDTTRSAYNDRPDYVQELIPWLAKKLEEVPVEYHDKVIIEFTSSEETCNVEEYIYYHRPATDEEMNADAEADRLRKERINNREREQYLNLKKKFEP